MIPSRTFSPTRRAVLLPATRRAAAVPANVTAVPIRNVRRVIGWLINPPLSKGYRARGRSARESCQARAAAVGVSRARRLPDGEVLLAPPVFRVGALHLFRTVPLHVPVHEAAVAASVMRIGPNIARLLA